MNFGIIKASISTLQIGPVETKKQNVICGVQQLSCNMFLKIGPTQVMAVIISIAHCLMTEEILKGAQKQ